MTAAPASLLATHRQQFPALKGKSYLNFGGQGPLAQPARAAIATAFDSCDRLGPFSKAAFSWVLSEQDALRQALATLLSATSDRITLTESTIAGMNIPLWGLDWRAGDRLLLSDAEHYGVWEIARELQARFGIEIDTCPLSNSQDCVQTLADYLQPATRMVCISHVLWNSGTVLPLAELTQLCQERNVLVHVDAAQSAGVLPLNLPELGVDYYAFTGHKWLCGPAGTGALYVSERGQAAIRPTFTGWCKTYAKGGAECFEVSTAAYPLRLGLKAAIELHDRFGTVQERYRQQIRTSQRLWSELQEIAGVDVCNPQQPQTGLVPFTVAERDPQELETLLEERGIYVRSMADPQSLRASVHYFTSDDDIDRLLSAIRTFV
ncbi:MAG: aminotransferase class V-fold PLP-dependent enzyme [Cyanobacteria bacterium J06597_1]